MNIDDARDWDEKSSQEKIFLLGLEKAQRDTEKGKEEVPGEILQILQSKNAGNMGN